MEQTITIRFAQAIGIIVGIVGGVTAMTVALLVYFDKKNERRIGDVKASQKEHHQEFKTELQEQRQETNGALAEHRQKLKAALQDIQSDERTLTSEVDRMQGNFDVLVFGERVPEPVAKERAETTGY